MGFSFSRGSQAGGKIRRSKAPANFRGVLQSGSTPTSPLYLYNNTGLNMVTIFRNPFDSLSIAFYQGTGTLHTTFSVGQNTWIDMIYFRIGGEDLTLNSFSVNGSPIVQYSSIRIGYGEQDYGTNYGYLQNTIDVYGYSLSVTADFYFNEGGQGTARCTLYVFPQHPMTMINTQGVVQYPTALSGYSVIRDT